MTSQSPKRAPSRQEILGRVAEALTPDGELSVVVQRIGRTVIPDLADLNAMVLVDKCGRPGVVSVDHVNPQHMPLASEMFELLCQHLADAERGDHRGEEGRRTDAVPAGSLSPRLEPSKPAVDIAKQLGVISAMYVPFELSGRTYGGIWLCNAESGRMHDREDLTIARHIARLVALALDREWLKQARETPAWRIRSFADDVGLFLDSMPDAVLGVDGDGRIRLANRQAEQVFGYSRSALVGRTIETLVADQFRDAHRILRDRYFANPAPRSLGSGKSFIARRSDGTEFPVDISLNPVQTAEGLLVMAAFRDVSERNALISSAELARSLAEQEHERLQTIVDQLPEAVVLTNSSGKVQMMNRAAIALTGRSESRIGRGSTGDLFRVFRPSGELLSWEQRPLGRACTTGETVQGFELLLETENGTLVPVLANAAPLKSNDDSIVGGAVVFQDMTALKIAQESRNTLFSMLAHELRTPITTIKGIASGLVLDGITIDAAELQLLLTSIGEEADRLTRLVYDLLDFARLEAGMLPLDLEAFHLIDLISARRAELGALTMSHHLSIGVPADLPEVVADYEQIRRVVTNLVENAAKYSPIGTRIDLNARVDSASRSLEVEVLDEGVGIPADQRNRVFEAYYRVPQNDLTGRRGTGLGLALAKGIVEAHRGSIWVENGRAGGSRFAFRLPLPDSVVVNGAPK